VDGHDNIRLCTSVVDYVFRVLGLEYLDRTDLAQVKPEELGMVRNTVEHATGKPVGFEHHRGPNGNGHDKKDGPVAQAAATPASASLTRRTSAPVESGQDAMLAKFPGDAPICDQCGHITIRNGTCYKCLNCGNSLGCS
jgi:ribonucleoside-diphosphate reductase alpha chain